jgi:hypothetical protein
MRGTVSLTLCAAAFVVALPAAADNRSLDPGRLAGRTQITFGCPGPAQPGKSCEHWSSFPNARFSLTRIGPAIPAPRIVRSNASGSFSLALAPGSYRIVPLPQAHTRGGAPLTVAISAGATAWRLVRFQGYPQML